MSIFHRCHLFELAFVWELIKETIHLSLGCLLGGSVLAGSLNSQDGRAGAAEVGPELTHLLLSPLELPQRERKP